jgi:ABC-type multidrug transport system fused ATPase/permease subunit
MHQIYRSFVKLRFIAPAVDTIAKEIEEASVQSTSTEFVSARLPLRESITLDNISFCYARSEIPVFKDVTANIRAGSITGIIGTTGAGKSTLVDLLLGLLEPTSGRVLVDGSTLTASARRAWNNNVGYVPQHIFLTDDTIARNIAFGVDSRAIDQAAVEHAARLAQIHDFISLSLPQGYDTVIGDKGCLLSGGQQQRLAIARALLKNAPILLLDEATSALDSESEQQIQLALETLSTGRTVIAIAHRLSTILSADQIVVMEAGRIKDVGTHTVLLEQSGYYRRLYDMQFSRDPADPATSEGAPSLADALA